MKLRIKLLAAAVCLLGAAAAHAATPWLTVQGNQIRDPNGNRTILRGISLIDLGAQQNWYGGVNSVIDRITNQNDTSGGSPSWNPKVIRLPVAPDGQGSPFTWRRNDGDNYYNNLLRPVVNYCKQKDLYCIIDLHYVANIDTDPNFVRDFWTYMAPRFANDSNVIFELFNEPISSNRGSDVNNWSYVKSYMQPWVNLVRAAAPRNLILAGTPDYCQQLVPAVSNPLSGGNIAYVVHTYPLHWGNGNSYQVNQIRNSANSIPLVMTEWGFTQTSDSLLNGSISSFGQPLMNLLDQYGISWTSWVASTDWGPPMFYPGWSLRVGPNEMGGFAKDALYSRRFNNLPSDGGGGGNQSVGNGTFRIVNRNSGKALDVYGNLTADGSRVAQWTYGGGNNQRWTLANQGSNQYRITGVASGKALDVSGGSTGNGTAVNIWTYGGGGNQKWTFASTSSGFYRMTPTHATGSCLDVNGSSTADGTYMQIWSYGGGNNQQWALQTP